jgi:hypothetical protein
MAYLTQFDLYKTSGTSFSKQQVPSKWSILALLFSEKVQICCGNKAIQRPQFRMKNSATNCARDTM